MKKNVEISPELVEKIKEINGEFAEKYTNHSTDEKKIIRQKLQESGS